ncbi:hypothetical protein ACN8ZM_35490 [Burkholderia aenigmatica]|uniref:hypothetical protein n=1 Tax=Burkholderia aenigmatica TaxID=2015348 RepID=UPI003B436957
MNVRKNARLAMVRRPEMVRRVIERGPNAVSAGTNPDAAIQSRRSTHPHTLAPARIAEQLRHRRVSFRFVLQCCQSSLLICIFARDRPA